MGPVLFSTNPFIKYLIHEEYRGGVHYVWCSEQFDSKRLAAYTSGSLVATNSNPVDIYKQLRTAVDSGDRKCGKIIELRASMTARALQWYADGEITENQREDIVYMLKSDDPRLWRPLLYVIPAGLVSARAELVAMEKRAGMGAEYIISDLKSNEFGIVEY